MRIVQDPSVPSARRDGFTLVEVLVVMMIIAILAGLAIGLLGTAGQQARIVRTKTLLKRMDDLVQAKLRDIDNDKSFFTKLATFRDATQGVSLTNSSNSEASDKVYAIVARKCLYRRALPVQTSDLNGWDTTNAWDDSPVKTMGGITSIVNEQDQACALFAALCPDGQVPEGISTDMVATSTSSATNGKLMFVDAWGKPVRFYLWPIRLIYGTSPAIPPPAASFANAQTLIAGLPAASDRLFKSDPSDPNGLIKQHRYKTASMSMPQAIDASNLHDLGFYSQFLLVSPGPDGALGLLEPSSGSSAHECVVSDATVLNDNITNRQGK